MLLVLVRSADALDAVSMSFFLMCILDLYLLSAFLMSLASHFILSAEYSYNFRSRNRSIYVISVFTLLYA